MPSKMGSNARCIIVPHVTVLFPKPGTLIAQLKTPIAVIVQVLSALTEGIGINAATRLYGVSKNSIYRWQERLSGLKKPLLLFALTHKLANAHRRR